MKPAPFDYLRPESLEEALEELSAAGEDAKVLAGGQSLVPVLNMRLLRPTTVVDLGRVPGLDRIESRNGIVGVGALVTQRTLEESPVARERLPLVAEALPHVGHFVTRNRGTIGGSIAHADAAAELPLCLTVLGGSVAVVGNGGWRDIPAAEFFVTHFTTTLAPGELVTETRWPAPEGPWGFAFEEFAQRRGDFALSAAAVALRVEDGRVAEARVGLASVTDRPTLIETELAGHALDATRAREAADFAAASIEVWDGLHASASYLRQLTRVCVERALLRAWENAA
ncbi:MAG: aerobic carbon-monoxide dehydrogenase medium subunit [Gaiellaceae bacterium]|nr:aerobic carbon-monoxide dehydrogenase medium subunit [Gaiellaceae bacterium]